MIHLNLVPASLESLRKNLRALARAILLAAIAGFALCGTSRAADPRPDLTVRTKLIEASVFRDDQP